LSLKVTGLSKTYLNGVKALKDLTLTIGNHMFGLLGPNGAGKSTLMRTVATLQGPDSGTVQLDDLNVLTQRDEVHKDVGTGYASPSRDPQRHHEQDRANPDGRGSPATNRPLERPEEVTYERDWKKY